jgi:hypothetical protein
MQLSQIRQGMRLARSGHIRPAPVLCLIYRCFVASERSGSEESANNGIFARSVYCFSICASFYVVVLVRLRKIRIEN